MALVPQTVTNNIVVGAGSVMVGALDTSDASQGFTYRGDTPQFSLNAASTNVLVESSDGPVATDLVNVPVKISYTGTVTFRNISDENLVLFLMGQSETVTQTATPVADESILSVTQGRYYQLGASSTNPSGVKGIGSVTVTDDVPNPAFTVTDDYIIDADQGTIYIVVGGAITTGTNLLVDYTPTANSRTRVMSDDTGSAAYEIKFFPRNTAGDDKEIYIPKCRLSPNGEMQLKSRDGAIDLVMDISVETRTGYEQLYIDGIAA
ncbi:MAG: hypothetical protein WBO93_08870 [Gammaproteobacteria bacterium]